MVIIMNKGKLISFMISFIAMPTVILAQINMIETSKETIISEQKFGGQVHFRLLGVEEGNNHYYILMYKDYRYPRLYSVEALIIDNKKSLLDIRNLIMEGFESNDREFRRSFELEGQLVTVSKMRQLGRTGILLYIDDKGHTGPLDKKRWERLFENVD